MRPLLNSEAFADPMAKLCVRSVQWQPTRRESHRTTPYGHRLAAYAGIAAALVLIIAEALL